MCLEFVHYLFFVKHVCIYYFWLLLLEFVFIFPFPFIFYTIGAPWLPCHLTASIDSLFVWGFWEWWARRQQGQFVPIWRIPMATHRMFLSKYLTKPCQRTVFVWHFGPALFLAQLFAPLFFFLCKIIRLHIKLSTYMMPFVQIFLPLYFSIHRYPTIFSSVHFMSAYFSSLFFFVLFFVLFCPLIFFLFTYSLFFCASFGEKNRTGVRNRS